MPLMSQPAFGPKLSIGFITGGALMDVWSLVWRYTIGPDTLEPNQRFWYMGFLLSGLTFVIIGGFLGSIGRAARKAELPPESVTPAVANTQQPTAPAPQPPAPQMPMNPAYANPMAGAPQPR